MQGVTTIKMLAVIFAAFQVKAASQVSNYVKDSHGQESLALGTHYQILGIEETAQLDEITKSYRTLAQKWHPDRPKNIENKEYTTAMFQKILEAYDVLRDHTKRALYDEELRNIRTQKLMKFEAECESCKNRQDCEFVALSFCGNKPIDRTLCSTCYKFEVDYAETVCSIAFESDNLWGDTEIEEAKKATIRARRARIDAIVKKREEEKAMEDAADAIVFIKGRNVRIMSTYEADTTLIGEIGRILRPVHYGMVNIKLPQTPEFPREHIWISTKYLIALGRKEGLEQWCSSCFRYHDAQKRELELSKSPLM